MQSVSGFLRRTLDLASKQTKKVGYQTLIRPQLEFTAFILYPYHKVQVQQAEVWRTGALCTCRQWRNTNSISDMLDGHEWPPVEAIIMIIESDDVRFKIQQTYSV